MRKRQSSYYLPEAYTEAIRTRAARAGMPISAMAAAIVERGLQDIEREDLVQQIGELMDARLAGLALAAPAAPAAGSGYDPRILIEILARLDCLARGQGINPADIEAARRRVTPDLATVAAVAVCLAKSAQVKPDDITTAREAFAGQYLKKGA